MRISFRQGINRYPYSGTTQQFLAINGATIDFTADNGPTEVTIAHRSTNYLHIENNSVASAWTFTGSVDNWLYWNIDLLTGERTFGVTLVEPQFGDTEPSSPVSDLHWFDTTNNIHYVYNGTAFIEVARVFAAKFDGVATFTSLSGGITNMPFAGTQVGSSVRNFSGRIVFDNLGAVIIRENGELFTTEDQFFVSGSQLNAVRLESNVFYVTATETLGAQTIVKITDAGAEPAVYGDTGSNVIALVMQSALAGDQAATLLQGVVRSSVWDWPTIGADLWISGDTPGVLVDEDPNVSAPSTYPVKYVPVARVVSATEIIFEQGLGGIGKTGSTGPGGAVVDAAATVKGISFLSIEPASPTAPIAVGTNDSRMSDARAPTAHSHTKSEISDFAHTHLISDVMNLQSSLDSKLALTGGTMLGLLTLSGAPTIDLHASTKKYVDDTVGAISLVASNVTLTPFAGSPQGISATNVQDGIEELNNEKSDINHMHVVIAEDVSYVVPPEALVPFSLLSYLNDGGGAGIEQNALFAFEVTTGGSFTIAVIVQDAGGLPAGPYESDNILSVYDQQGVAIVPTSDAFVYGDGTTIDNTFNEGVEVAEYTLSAGRYQVLTQAYDIDDRAGPVNILVAPTDGRGLPGGPAGTPTAVHTGIRFLGNFEHNDSSSSVQFEAYQPLERWPELETDLQNRHSAAGWIDGTTDDGHLFQFEVGLAGDFIFGTGTGWVDASGAFGGPYKGVNTAMSVYDSAGALVFTKSAETGEYQESAIATLAIGTYQIHVHQPQPFSAEAGVTASPFSVWVMDNAEGLRRSSDDGGSIATGNLSVGLHYDRQLAGASTPGVAGEIPVDIISDIQTELDDLNNDLANRPVAYDLAGQVTGVPDPGAIVFRHIAIRKINIGATFTHLAKADTASTGTAVFEFKVNGVTEMTITFTTDDNAVFADVGSPASWDRIIEIGDEISIVAPTLGSPAASDATLADISISLLGSI